MSELLWVLPALVVAVAAAVGLVLRRPVAMAALLVALDGSNLTGVLAEHTGVSLLPVLLLGAALVALLGARGPQGRDGLLRGRLVRSPSLALGGVLAATVLSVLTSRDQQVSVVLLGGRVRDVLFFIALLALLGRTTDAVRRPVAVLVATLAGLAALSLVHQFVLGGTGDLGGLSRIPLVEEGGALTPRHAGTSSDVNFWARLLVLVLPLGMSLAASAGSDRSPAHRTTTPGHRWPITAALWWTASAALLGGIYLTQSRGGFLAVAVAVVTWMVLAGPRSRRALPALPFAAAGLLVVSGAGSRLLTLWQSVRAPTLATADPSVVTRERFQEVAWRMFLERPVTGQGAGTYGTLFPVFDRFSDLADPVTIVVAAHNFYLEQAADGGVVLLAAWGVLFATVVLSAARTVVTAEDARARALAVGVVAALAGWLVASLFLHLSDLRVLLTLVAVTVALQWRSPQRSLRVARRLPARSVPGLALVCAVLAVASAVVATSSTFRGGAGTWRSTTTVPIVVAGSGTPWVDAYDQDLLTRGTLVPTMGEVVSRNLDLDSVTVRPTPSGGALQLVVAGTDPQTVAAQADSALAEVDRTVSGLFTPWTTRVREPAPPAAVEPVVPSGVPAGLALGFAVLAAVLLRRVPRGGDRDQGRTTRSERHGTSAMLS